MPVLGKGSLHCVSDIKANNILTTLSVKSVGKLSKTLTSAWLLKIQTNRCDCQTGFLYLKFLLTMSDEKKLGLVRKYIHTDLITHLLKKLF